jgi:hypothetical protein
MLTTAVRRLFGFRESFQRVTVVARRVKAAQAEHSATVIWLHSLLAPDDGLPMPQHWDYFKPLFYPNQQHE